MTITISKFFNKQFTPVVQVTSVNKPVYYSDNEQDLTDDEKSEDKAPIKPVEDVKPVEKVKPIEDISNSNMMNKAPVEDELDELDDVSNVSIEEDVKHDEDNSISGQILKVRDEMSKKDKEAKGIGLFSFRKDTKETLQSLLDRIVKLESVISYQNEQIKQLKTGIKSINQALPSSIRKDAFGNYFSNSLDRQSPDSLEDSSEELLGGALNPDKVYPKITFSEFRKLYNKL